MLGAIEAGGTKFVLAVGNSPQDIAARHVIPTRDPAATLAEAAAWFDHQGPLSALGIASFGPLELDRRSATWGFIGNTPKPGWSRCNIAGYFSERLAVAVGFDTDVNAAALAEYITLGTDACASLAYITIGTGIGGGLVIDGRSLHGAAHPEMGHIFPQRHPRDGSFPGVCPHHGGCLEGLASGPAIKARWGRPLSDLPTGHEAHEIVADYVAQLCHSLFALTSVEVAVLGGGVSQTPGLLERIARRARELSAGYLPGAHRHRIVPPSLGPHSGITGAMMLAEAASPVAKSR